jgi:TPR repeat protein
MKEFLKLTTEYTEKYLKDPETFKDHLEDLEKSLMEDKGNSEPMPQWQKLSLFSANSVVQITDQDQIKLLALIGDKDAEMSLGASYLEGYETDQDYKKALFWLSRAEKEDRPMAHFCIGVIYYYGCGVSKDYKKALNSFLKSIELRVQDLEGFSGWNNTDVETFIGNIYNIGGSGVAQNLKLAFDWYSAVAKKGDAEGQIYLGVCYDFGKGVNIDYKEALNWYLKSAEQGFAAAQGNLGYIYFNGRDVPQDIKAALGWYAKAAKQGNLIAINQLGFVYEYGYGVTQDYKMAYEWYKSAAEQGFAEAQTNLGKLYLKGNGVLQDYVKAVKWLTKAAEQESSEAQLVLGIMHSKGEYFDLNKQKGASWINIARKNGNEQAEKLWNEEELWKHE